jgi:glycerol uptake facilitator-like aquaporin
VCRTRGAVRSGRAVAYFHVRISGNCVPGARWALRGHFRFWHVLANGKLIPNEALRRLIAGFLFGGAGAIIALSTVGKVSGAHIKPIVTLGFYLVGKLDFQMALGHIVAQLLSGVLGALSLVAWGTMGRSVAFGATAPGPGYSIWGALLGEVITICDGCVAVIVFLFSGIATVLLRFSCFSIRSRSASRPPHRARAPILRAALVRPQCLVLGRVGGSTGLVHCWACWQRSLPAAMKWIGSK